MTERKIFGIKIPSLLPQEGYSVLKHLDSNPETAKPKKTKKRTDSPVIVKPQIK